MEVVVARDDDVDSTYQRGVENRLIVRVVDYELSRCRFNEVELEPIYEHPRDSSSLRPFPVDDLEKLSQDPPGEHESIMFKNSLQRLIRH